MSKAAANVQLWCGRPGEMSAQVFSKKVTFYSAMVLDGSVARDRGGRLSASMYLLTVSLWMPNNLAIPLGNGQVILVARQFAPQDLGNHAGSRPHKSFAFPITASCHAVPCLRYPTKLTMQCRPKPQSTEKMSVAVC